MAFSGNPTTGTREDTRYAVTQQARTYAPEGPRSVGTITDPGEVALQGGVSYAHVRPGEGRETQSSLGHLVQDRSAHGRLSFGTERAEAAISGVYSHEDWATSTSDALPDNLPRTAHESKFLGSVQTRFLIAGDRRLGLGLLLEADLGTVNFQRTTEITSNKVLIRADGSEERLPRETEVEQAMATDVFWAAKGGLQLFYSPISWITLQGGIMGQNHTSYWSYRVFGTACEDEFYDDMARQCSGDTPEDLPRRTMAHLGTLFGGASLAHPSLPLSAHAQIHYNVIGTSTITRALPFGATLALRLSL